MVYIVTTSIEKKFLQNEDCIFAGRWCLKDSLEDINITDENTPLYHWDVKGLLSSDRFYLSYINEQVLSKLSKCLNEVLETSNDIEYWRLVVGYWVNIYCTVLFDRWQILKSCVEKAGTANILSLEVDESQFSTCDLDEFIKLSTESSEWNYYLFLKIADEFKSINKIYLNEKLILKKYSKKSNFINKFIQKYIIKKLYSIVFSLKNNHKFYSIKTYLPYIYELQLKLKIGEFPVLPGASFFDSERIDSNNSLRKLIKLEDNLINDRFLEFTLKMVKDFLPTIYLEGYWQTLEDLKGSHFPKNPKTIYTANLHFSADKFKIWMAEKKKSGTSIVIGEHGGLRIAKFNESHDYEKKIADYYLITGAKFSQDKKFIPIGNFRMQGKTLLPKLNGKIVIITTTVPQYAFIIRASIIGPQFFNYFKEVMRLIDSIETKNIIVRVNKSDYDWHQSEQIRKRFPNIEIDEGNKKLIDLLKNSSMAVCTYNGTVFIDTISLNFPTIITWNPIYWEISDEAREIFLDLELAGIFHCTPEKAAKFINSITSDINKWWFSDQVQSALDKFRFAYGSKPCDVLMKIKEVITST